MKKIFNNSHKNTKYLILDTKYSSRGFTLIEIIVTVAIISVATAFGIASYSTFQKNQELKIAAADLKNNLRLYQSKALSSEKPAYCPSLDHSLYGYQVDISSTGYKAYASCSITVDENNKASYNFPTNITAQSTGPIVFKTLTGGAESETIINLCGHHKLYTITVTKGGDIKDDGVTGSC